MKGVHFARDEERIASFLRVPAASVVVTKSSPLKRRVSITDLVTDVNYHKIFTLVFAPIESVPKISEYTYGIVGAVH